jgi:hypothetical protein
MAQIALKVFVIIGLLSLISSYFVPLSSKRCAALELIVLFCGIAGMAAGLIAIS